jgi:hypothetical protein
MSKSAKCHNFSTSFEIIQNQVPGSILSHSGLLTDWTHWSRLGLVSDSLEFGQEIGLGVYDVGGREDLKQIIRFEYFFDPLTNLKNDEHQRFQLGS